MDARHNSGITLVELLVTIAAIAVLASFALPSMTVVIQNNALIAGVNSVIVGFSAARAEALKREFPVTICRTNEPNAGTPACATGTGWATGWVVFVDEDGDAVLDNGEEVLVRGEPLEDGSTIYVLVDDADAPLDDSVTYLPNGFPNFANRVEGGRHMLFCDGRNSNANARVINVEQTGRTRVRAMDEVGDIGVTCE